MKKFINRYVYLTAFCFLLFTGRILAQSLLIENLEGPLTQNEITAFKTYMQTRVQPPVSGVGNVWVFGPPGKAIEACGLMYEASKDIEILNRMVFYCDAALSLRNDNLPAANGLQVKTWTGNVEPVWPSAVREGVAGAGVEQGAVLSHMAYCSRLILENPLIWDIEVPDANAGHKAETYKQRALRYIRESNYVLDNWIFPRFVRKSDSLYYFPGAPNTYKANEAAPWNQAFMVTNALVRLAECYSILKTEKQRMMMYDAVVKANLAFFFKNLRVVSSAAGTRCYIFDYAHQQRIEDANHFAYDVEGLWIAYNSGRYGLEAEELVPFANTYADIILAKITNGKFVGRLDGTTTTGNSGGDNYVRDEYFYLTEFRPEKFIEFATIDSGKAKSSPPITARILWQKNKRYMKSKIRTGSAGSSHFKSLSN